MVCQLLVTNGNGYQIPLLGLGKIQVFANLSEKRVTRAVREALRTRYGEENVEVSCAAKFVDGCWEGKCMVQGQDFEYQISK